MSTSISTDLHSECKKQIEELECKLTDAKLKIWELENYSAESKARPESTQYFDCSTQYDINDFERLTAKDLADVASESVAKSSYVYDYNMKMYYDEQSKCYYDAERGLFYQPYSGLYYKYNEITQTYDVVSQIDQQDFNAINHLLEQKNKQYISSHKKISKGNNHDDNIQKVADTLSVSNIDLDEMEDGELMSDDGDGVNCDDGERNIYNEQIQLYHVPQNIQNCIPCIRVVVKRSKCLKVNTLFILTCRGASIGRDPSLNHDILMKDPHVAKMHCSVSYDENKQRYTMIDHASASGTFVNGKRIGEAHNISPSHTLYHLDEITIGASLLSIHIHPRHDTCNLCEPGMLIGCNGDDVIEDEGLGNNGDLDLKQKKQMYLNKMKDKKRLDDQRKEQLKKIKQKYGLKNQSYESRTSCTKDNKYVDRSKQRQQTVGSDNPYVDGFAVDAGSSVNKSLTSNNKGHILMMKMGWKDGQALGKMNNGIIEPIQVTLRIDETAGFGSQYKTSLDNVHSVGKMKRWIDTKKRFDAISDGCM